MSELRVRVVERLTAAFGTGDVTPLRDQEAVTEALALLAEATPSPEDSIDLDAVAAVFWTFWGRHQGAEDPDSVQNTTVAVSAFGFLCPRLPTEAGLPDSLKEGFDAADPSHEARFAHLVCSVHAGVAVSGVPQERAAALDRALAWSDASLEFVHADDQLGFVELAVYAHDLWMHRFQTQADPDGLANAARYGREVCRRLAVAPGLFDPDTARAAAAACLRTVIDSARLLGSPGLARVERLVTAVPDDTLTPEAAEGLRLLRVLEAQPVGWPGEFDLRIGSLIVEAGVAEQDAGRVACGVRRLRAAYTDTPAGHPERGAVTVALGSALAAFAQACEDEDAALEAAQLLASGGALNEDRSDTLATYQEFASLAESDAPDAMRRAAPLLDRLAAQERKNAAREGRQVDLEVEALSLIVGFADDDDANDGGGGAGDGDGGWGAGGGGRGGGAGGGGRGGGAGGGDGGEVGAEERAGGPTGEGADERIGRYRSAFALLTSDHPKRHAHLAVLAALTGLRAEALRHRAPARAGLLEAESRELTEEALALAPPGFPATDLLRRGILDVALPVAALTITADIARDEDMPDEIRRAVAALSRMSEIRLDSPEHLDSAATTLREILDATDDDDLELRRPLSGALGSILSAGIAERPDPAVLEEVVRLLREAGANSGDAPSEYDRILAHALSILSLGSHDAEGAREAAALLASAPAPTPEETALQEGAGLSRTDQEVLTARAEFHNALQNYVFGHEPAQLERARRIAHGLREITRAGTSDGEEPPWYDLMGDAYVDLVESVGPGGPRPDLDDGVVEQCRRTFSACPVGHPMRIMATMTLVRVLMQRSAILRAVEPERARALLTEARSLEGVLKDLTPDGSPIDLADVMGPMFDLIGRDRLPDISTTDPPAPVRRPDTSAADDTACEPARGAGVLLGPLAAFADGLRSRLAGREPAEGWDDLVGSAWMRANGEIGAAARAIGGGEQGIGPALTHLEAAVEAMAGITDRGSDQASAEHGLSTFEGDIRGVVELILCALDLRESAVRIEERVRLMERDVRALDAGHPPGPDSLPAPGQTVRGPDVARTAELLERGRGLLLARRIEARADISGLQAAFPELAERFQQLTDRLDARLDTQLDTRLDTGLDIRRGTRPGTRPEADASAAGAAEWARLAALRTSNELDDLVEHIRTQPGFEDFLRPLTAAGCRALAADGPVVVLNHGRRYCHALVITRQSVTSLRLVPGADEITEAARRLRDAVDAINAQGASRPSPLRLVAAGKAVRETLAWIWHGIVRPVLESVGPVATVPREGEWPRVWWVATGPFSALPLHAAECTAPECAEEGCGAALDTVVSSYAPGLQTLAYARARARRRDTADHGSALLVAAREDDLPGVAAAATHAAELLGARPPLIGPAATREAVLTALHEASWAHFGCHAASDPAEPSGALLHLPSGEPVSVLEICRVRPRSARLVFLAACGTARAAERLVDEAIHITSSFLLAGFPTAVGTLWTIDSMHADHMTRDFYRRTTAPDSPDAAQALHDTVRQLRRRIPDRPHIWATYVHAGA
ncbi:CHAT domain-containing protein [Streptomyces sp. NPDC048462]|uniref:CHAT domain-containing protein n=1 Tax=Streptomyces sp. NPDC048462 TaxID=3365555 RepID=UPI00371B150A